MAVFDLLSPLCIPVYFERLFSFDPRSVQVLSGRGVAYCESHCDPGTKKGGLDLLSAAQWLGRLVSVSDEEREVVSREGVERERAREREKKETS